MPIISLSNSNNNNPSKNNTFVKNFKKVSKCQGQYKALYRHISHLSILITFDWWTEYGKGDFLGFELDSGNLRTLELDLNTRGV